jgi:hypothetical protein
VKRGKDDAGELLAAFELFLVKKKFFSFKKNNYSLFSYRKVIVRKKCRHNHQNVVRYLLYHNQFVRNLFELELRFVEKRRFKMRKIFVFRFFVGVLET